MAASEHPTLDPFQYVGRVTRDDTGRVRNIEVVHQDESITVESGDEFITFVTVITLDKLDDMPPLATKRGRRTDGTPKP
jgi:hypothetical protein